MQFITLTNLRTQAKKLASALENGQEIKLVKRSVVIGKIIPNTDAKVKTINAEQLEAKIKKLDFPKLTLKEIDRRYRAAMIKKHGKGLS